MAIVCKLTNKLPYPQLYVLNFDAADFSPPCGMAVSRGRMAGLRTRFGTVPSRGCRMLFRETADAHWSALCLCLSGLCAVR